MKAALNPFSPGSGLRPPALVGRDAELAAMDALVERVAIGRVGRGIILSGLRGVGKTVLLNEMRSKAEDAGWFAVSLEARPNEAGQVSARKTLAREISVQARQLSPRKDLSERVKKALRAVSAFSVKVGAGGIDLGVEIQPGRADSGLIEVDLPELVQDLCEALAEEGRAFGLFVDEFQDLDKDLMVALLATQHQAGQRSWPFYLVGAGLPHLPRVLSEARSYAERLFDYRTISRLPETQAAEALVEPVVTEGVDFAEEALRLLVEASDGYPYFLQEYGGAAWEAALEPKITYADAQTAVTIGLERLDGGFFRSRWERATPAERRMLVAMAEDGEGPSSSGTVAQRMGMKPTSLGPYRAGLINKGLIYAPEHGQIAYTVPGMGDFVHRHRDDADA